MYSAGYTQKPVAMRNALIVALGLPIIGPIFDELASVKPPTDGTGPLRANLGERVTHGIKQYQVQDDSPTAIFGTSSAQEDLKTFLETLLGDEQGIPTIPVP